ncbi:MAG: YdcH family protein [Hyphomicrobiaceae bacterium]
MPQVLLQELAEEFPELKDKIQKLQANDVHFAKLVSSYRALDREIHDVEEHEVNVSDETFETMKKQRLRLKDVLYAMLKH